MVLESSLEVETAMFAETSELIEIASASKIGTESDDHLGYSSVSMTSDGAYYAVGTADANNATTVKTRAATVHITTTGQHQIGDDIFGGENNYSSGCSVDIAQSVSMLYALVASIPLMKAFKLARASGCI